MLISTQNSVLSAATLIMIMVVASRALGLVRQRTLAHFFTPDDLSLFFAAFRLPDLVFEVLVFGTFSSAFIPVFAKLIKSDKKDAWDTAGVVVNIGIVIFLFLALLLGSGADFLYQAITPGYSLGERERIVEITRLLFAAQGFFVVSYVLTGVLESMRHFLVPALAPLFYNIGIIAGTIFLSPKMGLLGPAVGVVAGAFLHFVIQLPLAIKLGFRPTLSIKPNSEVKKIGKLALPRIVEVSFMQISKVVELFFASLISKAAYTYYTFGNSLQLLPVGIFGTSIAKAALPTLASQSDDLSAFKKTLFSTLYDMAFFVIPVSALLIVLRTPIVRLIYGTDIFSWEATTQTGYALTAFALGIFFQTASALLARSFYAMHDTKTPVVISVFSMVLTIILDFVFIKIAGLPVWGLALAFSFGSILQALILFVFINRRLENGSVIKALVPIFKIIVSSVGSGLTMFFLLKIFDRSVWIKRLSFIGKIEATKNYSFERYLFDTRYTVNLLILSLIVSFVGMVVYIILSIALRSDQVWNFFNLIKRIIVKKQISPIPAKKEESVSPTPNETTG